MSVQIRLLGRPGVSRDGEDVGLRGHKAWLLFTLLLLADAPVSRDRLVRLLFIDAADPAAALRWNLSHLRHRLGVDLSGDPVTLALPSAVAVDVQELLRGDADVAARMPGLDDSLLGGVRVEGLPELEVWLEDERRHLRQLAIDVRQEAALKLLGQGDGQTAVALARLVAQARPLDENAAALLVRCLRETGQESEARIVAESAAARLRAELGVEPTEALWAAVAAPPIGDRRLTGHSAVTVQLEMGETAVAAGALDTGVASLRNAVMAARAGCEPALLARGLVALGSALIHGVRGVDQEGLALLHEAVPLTDGADDSVVAAKVRREIGYVDFLRGRYDRAGYWFDLARKAAGGDPSELGWVDLYDGASHDDVGDLVHAARLLNRALGIAQARQLPRMEAYALSMLGRHHLVQGDMDASVSVLDEALQIVHALDWTAFRSFPELLLADAVRGLGDLGRARQLSEHGFALGEQMGDPCWESMGLRSLGLVAVDSGDVERGVALLHDAPPQCRRLPDTYRWIELWGYDALAEVAGRYRLHDARAWATQLEHEASTLGMRPLAQHAHRLLSG